MQRSTLFLWLTLCGVWFHGAAAAQEARGDFGLGAAAMLGGAPGIQFVYDPGQWHLDVIASARGGDARDGNPMFAAGVRGWYHLHTAGAADFSLGGGLGYAHYRNGDVLHPELGAQIRAFIVPNVALSTTAGLAIFTVDREGVLFSGQLMGNLAVTYFF